MPLHIIEKDITKINVDAIVNSTNRHMVGFSGVDSLLHEIGGKPFDEECEKLAYSCDLGQSVYTNAYNLPCKFIIHTMSVGYQGGNKGEAAIIRSCYWTALSAAEDLGCRSVAFPLISAGSLSFPIPKALEIAVTTISEYLSLYTDMEVYLTIYGEAAKEIAKSMSGELEAHIKETYKAASFDNLHSLEELVNNTGKEFADMLIGFISQSGMTDSQVYKKAHVKKAAFNKIINGDTKKPTMETAIALAMALGLSYEDTAALLASAGMAFSNSSKFDIIAEYFLKNNNHDMWEFNEQLIKYGYKSIIGAE